MKELKKIDIGSGGFKRPGHIGVDVLPAGAGANHDIDIVCDIERERWPLENNSVSHVFSSHCFEHLHMNTVLHVWKEMTRVCADGAEIEIWNPHVMHRDAYVHGHTMYWSEEIYYHLCMMQDAWSPTLGGRWFLREVRYHVDPALLASCASMNMSADFAINHLINVIKEFGIFIRVDKSGTSGMHLWDFERTLVDDVATTPIRESRELNRRVLSKGGYMPKPAPAFLVRLQAELADGAAAAAG